MVDDCPMTEDCPAYDRDRRMCLVEPGDCEVSTTDGEAAVDLEPPEGRASVASAEAAVEAALSMKQR